MNGHAVVVLVGASLFLPSACYDVTGEVDSGQPGLPAEVVDCLRAT